MSDTLPSVDLATLDLTLLQEQMTPREIGRWEIATGTPFADFPPTWLGAVLMWWAANASGEPMTPDQALDLVDPVEVERLATIATQLLGKALPPAATAGDGKPSGESTGSAGSPSPGSP